MLTSIESFNVLNREATVKTLMFLAWFGGLGADTASTQYALQHGAHEAILSQRPWVNHLVIAGEGAGGAWGLQRLSTNHPKMAVALGVGVGVLRAGIAAHNVQVVNQMQRR
jgi:hypothetical protein